MKIIAYTFQNNSFKFIVRFKQAAFKCCNLYMLCFTKSTSDMHFLEIGNSNTFRYHRLQLPDFWEDTLDLTMSCSGQADIVGKDVTIRCFVSTANVHSAVVEIFIDTPWHGM